MASCLEKLKGSKEVVLSIKTFEFCSGGADLFSVHDFFCWYTHLHVVVQHFLSRTLTDQWDARLIADSSFFGPGNRLGRTEKQCLVSDKLSKRGKEFDFWCSLCRRYLHLQHVKQGEHKGKRPPADNVLSPEHTE